MMITIGQVLAFKWMNLPFLMGYHIEQNICGQIIVGCTTTGIFFLGTQDTTTIMVIINTIDVMIIIADIMTTENMINVDINDTSIKTKINVDTADTNH